MIKDKTIYVIGSGTGGLISALMIKSLYPNINCNIIHNPKKKIIGVGEGTTEHLNLFMKVCGINRIEFMLETDGVPKKGLYFKNWFNNKDINYFHYINDNDIGKGFDDEFFDYKPFPLKVAANLIENSQNIDIEYQVPNIGIIDKDILFINTFNQFHFDSQKLFIYLTKKCKEKGINIIEDDVIDVKKNAKNDIEILIGEKDTYQVDFVIDSSGFERAIFQKYYHVDWISLDGYLPFNSAIVTQTADDSDELFPFTLAQGLTEGWLWRAPTRNRYGNGYVFNRHYSDINKISAEFSDVLSVDDNEFRQINFDPGYLSKNMINNVFSIGLSVTFFEPIEASSIGLTITNVMNLANLLPDYFNGFDISNEVNTYYRSMVKNIYSFIKFHYISPLEHDKNWTELMDLKNFDWEDELYEKWKTRLPSILLDRDVFTSYLYGDLNFVQIGYGTEFFTSYKLKKYLSDLNININKYKWKCENKFEKFKSKKSYYKMCEDYIRNINNIEYNLISGDLYYYQNENVKFDDTITIIEQ